MGEHQMYYDNIWEMILSRQSEIIGKVYESLDPEQRETVLDHLRRMVTEPGWQLEQRISAQAALDEITNHED
jgi:hypothetical protein